MTLMSPEPARTRRIEPKVAWSTIGSYATGVILLAFLNLVDNNSTLISAAIPDAYEPFILPILPALACLASGYLARHQWRVSPRPSGSPPVG